MNNLLTHIKNKDFQINLRSFFENYYIDDIDEENENMDDIIEYHLSQINEKLHNNIDEDFQDFVSIEGPQGVCISFNIGDSDSDEESGEVDSDSDFDEEFYPYLSEISFNSLCSRTIFHFEKNKMRSE